MPPEICPLLLLGISDPAYLVAVLFLVGLAIVILIQMRQYKRIGKLVDDIDIIRDLRSELSEMKKSLDQLDTNRILSVLDDLSKAREKPDAAATPLAPVEATGFEPEDKDETDIYKEIEERLESLGFKNVSILSDIPELAEDPDKEFRLPVEALRDGAVFKGYAVIRGNKVVSERIQPAYEAFP